MQSSTLNATRSRRQCGRCRLCRRGGQLANSVLLPPATLRAAVKGENRLKWGTRHFAEGASHTHIATIILAAMQQRGLRPARVDQSDGRITLTATRRVWFWLNQIMTWEVSARENPGGAEVCFDARYTTASRIVLAMFGAAATYFWIAGFSTFLLTMTTSAPVTVQAFWQPAIAVALAFSTTILVISAGSREAIFVLDQVRNELRIRGQILDRRLKESWLRQAFSGVAILGYFVVVNLITLTSSHLNSGFHPKSSSNIALFAAAIALLVVIACAGVGMVFLASRRRGAEERLVLVTPALQSSVALMLMLASQLSFRLLAQPDRHTWNGFLEARTLLVSNTDPVELPSGVRVPRAELELRLGQLQLMIGALVGLAAGLWTLAAVFFYRSLGVAALVAGTNANLHQDLHAPTARAAASGEGFMARFRVSLVIVWALTSLMTMIGAASVISMTVSALLRAGINDASASVSVVEATTMTLHLLLGLGVDSSRWIAWLFWLGWAGMLIAAIGLSCGHYFARRRRAHIRLIQLAARTNAEATYAPLRHILSTLVARTKCPTLGLAVSGEKKAYACAHAFGLRQRDRFIEISQGTVELLDRAEIEAILAHEVAHHIKGHCRRHNWLHLLGRITLFGGAFVGSLENSFGYELDADQVAVARLGASPAALKSALLKMRAATVLEQFLRPSFRRGIPLTPDAIQPSQSPSLGARIAAPLNAMLTRIRLWLAIYASDGDIAYWHPSVNDRIAALERRFPSGIESV